MKTRQARDAIRRQWELLRLLKPNESQTAAQLQERLARAGFETTKRTVERDLDALSAMFPITVNDKDKPYGWRWRKDAPVLSVPGLTAPQALSFDLVRRFLESLLPASVLQDLDPYFETARKRLADTPKGRGMPRWSEKIRVLHPAQTLLPPLINSDVRRTVYEALLQNLRLEIMYHKRGATAPAQYTVHPLALVQRGPVIYLVCTLFDYEDVLLLALHRILSAILQEEPARRPKDFELDQHIASGKLDFGSGERIRFEAVFLKDAAEHLHETPLSEDQTINPVDGERVRVSATVADTPQLAWWLMAFGEQVEVIRPSRLREALAATATALYRLYHKPGRP